MKPANPAEKTKDIKKLTAKKAGNEIVIESNTRKTFTISEDQALRVLVNKFGDQNCWKKISSIIGTRTPRQCRERWHNYLRPDIVNGPWSKEEEDLLKELYLKYGPNWSRMRESFPTRSNPNIKNHWAMINSQNKKEEANPKKINIHELTVMINAHKEPIENQNTKKEEDDNSNNQKVSPNKPIFELPHIPMIKSSTVNFIPLLNNYNHFQQAITVISHSNNNQPTAQQCDNSKMHQFSIKNLMND